MRPVLPFVLACLVLPCASRASAPPAGSLAPAERAVADAISTRSADAFALLERLVEINSGTHNPAGVREVARVLGERFEALGFTTEWQELPPEVERAGHLVARRPAAAPGAPKVLLIGHLDTVFEAGSPFQHFAREGDVAHGPGALDMKGGDVAILLALEGLDPVALGVVA